ncbi:alpha-ketoglutarate-dependent dioxygenase AlkB [Kovacikia minuta CCNUW1]|uniref:alpha-ketoglutarate-dependent dioxygenase AlkB n=1 Tax=Kovacikia minuta TaxID=2931930 RepID=UPI001CCBB498|nr:alpha-ketoglutarate-dependent dioxygenase AlkB [Kovacikia minuta]UBF26976.1 alpha-ketoglutarate-dependent dioxygenase AlkB [Kovacikia minuta CCNUW1]
MSLLETPSVPDIPGLRYLPDYLTAAEEGALVAAIEQAGWENGGMRRLVRQFGYRYSFSRRSMAPGDFREALPNWGASIARRLHQGNLLPAVPNQMLANRYLPGEGISFHVDAAEFNEIAALSLLSACVMEFRHGKTGEKQKIWLEPRSLLILEGAARWDWQHGIPYRKRDRHAGREQLREPRISLTFRIFPTE